MSSELIRFGDLFGDPQRNGLTRPKKVRGVGLPMVNMGELFAHSRILNIPMDLVPVSEKESHYLLREGDLLFARQSLVLSGAGQCSIFLGNSEPTVFESHLIRCRLDLDKAYPLFYFYFFKSPDGKKAIEAIVEQGAGASGIRGSDLVNVQVPFVSKNDQVEIAENLGSLDDQIALLHETNQTIESIAQAIFKSWFIDFDPVKAKSEGLVPGGIDEATVALFPDSFQKSAIGLKPHAWPILTFKETIKITGGGTPKTTVTEYWNGDIPWFSVVDAPSPSDVFVIDTEKHITEAGLHGSSTKMLPEGTTIISARGTVGKLALTGVPMTMNQSCYGLKGLHGDSYFTFYSTKRLVDQLKQNVHGAVFDTITMDTLSTVYVAYPPEALIGKFEEMIAPLMDSMKNNLNEIKTLSELRDTLLPRLISGKLRLPETTQEAVEMA